MSMSMSIHIRGKWGARPGFCRHSGTTCCDRILTTSPHGTSSRTIGIMVTASAICNRAFSHIDKVHISITTIKGFLVVIEYLSVYLSNIHHCLYLKSHEADDKFFEIFRHGLGILGPNQCSIEVMTSSKTPELLMIILAQHRAPMDSPHIEPEAGKNTLYAPWIPSSSI